ncbi:VanZ family protein [Georgenia sp. TF02-10]|uniref:VanZ family protein n=1 Tax=Georgenia sp. TF02-10 TaxID=2917725 RepID=UPI001FA755BD|nr:VanZ family protein [Georgenia sp. TF02-10]UNX53984.1 VanZ family protein [Georgenia sp. TF02-10]
MPPVPPADRPHRRRAPAGPGAPPQPRPPDRRSPDRRARWWWLLAAALAAQLLVLYAPQLPGGGPAALPGADKVGHAAVFALVTVAGLRAGVRPWLVVAYGLAQAGVSETLQHLLLPGRTGDPADVLADLAGVGLGLVLARAAGRRSSGAPPG